jgi:hypothetical protein
VTLAELIASGRATASVEEVATIIEVGRCTAFEHAAAGTLPTIRVGRRLLVPVPRLLAMLGVPLPEEWQPAGALAARCPCGDAASDSDGLGSVCPKVGAPGDIES